MEYVINVEKNMKNNKIRILVILLCVLLFSGCGKEEKNAKYNIIATNFPGYDFARAIAKDTDINVEMLLKPGSEIHHFEPTPKDIINIQKSDIFIYVGGESDAWIDDVLKDIDTSKTKVIKLMDYVEVLEEEIVEGMESAEHEHEEYDEHIWTSPKNAITIIKKLTQEIKNIDNDEISKIESNSNKYIEEIETIDKNIQDIVSNSKRKEIVFGDRFPLRYFVKQYGLKYFAAFPGCSEQTEASAKTIAFLIKKVKDDNIPVIFHIELSNKKIAETISSETGAKVLEFHSVHNISQKDFDDGITYTDLMKKNIDVLREALN